MTVQSLYPLKANSQVITRQAAVPCRRACNPLSFTNNLFLHHFQGY